eukprot:TRINITY_DN2485_c0_g2_i2.p1 TRINITY_DN2485_c0_g2~~TRINITY_DN2485_c0_g2_i2.p1  ORF type:complete len:132 (-),score=27.11 TRINITY_DN2485_c0_g2_i2:315-710(-)
MPESSYTALKERILYILKFKDKYLTLRVFFFGNIFLAFAALTKVPVMFLVLLSLLFIVGIYLVSAYRCRVTNNDPLVAHPQFRVFNKVNERELEFAYTLLYELLNDGVQCVRDMVMLKNIKTIAVVPLPTP